MCTPSFSIGMSAFSMAPSVSSVGKEACSSSTETSADVLSNEVKEEETQSLIDSLHLDIESVNLEDCPVVPSQVTINVQGKPSFEFLDEDESFQRSLAEGGGNASAAVDRWARNRLNKFRLFKGLSVTVPLEDLPAADCSCLLTKFFEQVTKKDGALYPSQTLMGLYRAFHRILRRKQELRIHQSGKDEPTFCMRSSPLFKQVGVSCVLAMERSRRAGANQPRKKAVVISLADEGSILSHPCTSALHPRGLQRRAVFYLLCCFAIRGGTKLYNLGKEESRFGEDEAGRYVQ